MVASRHQDKASGCLNDDAIASQSGLNLECEVLLQNKNLFIYEYHSKLL